MKRILFCLIVFSAALTAMQQSAQAGGPHYISNHWGERFARTMPWHGNYYYHPRGATTALVVPPVSNMQTSLSWGVTQTSMMPIYHQYQRPYPGGGAGMGVGALPTPRWPSHTDQFGVYYIRGPW